MSSCLTYKNNELWIEQVRVNQIAAQFGTPCYVYSRARLTQNWLAFANAFANVPHRICYAVKANSNIAILHLLAQLGAGFDIVSGGELERVLVAGGDPKKIVFSGVGKSADELRHAIELGIFCIDVESLAELERVQSIAASLHKTATIALRVNPNVDPNTHAHISTGLKENKFGIPIDEVLPLAKKLINMPALKLIGIACHIGSQILTLEPYVLAIDRLLDTYHELQNIGISIRYLNIGGGLGIQYQQESPPAITDYAKLLQTKLAHLPIEIIIEPGRAIVGNAGFLLTKVEYLKHNAHKNFAIIDAGMNDLIRPTLYDAWQAILPVQQRQQPPQVYDIAGPVCESADILGKDRQLSIEEGDLLAIDSAGAYGFSMSSNYNSRGRAAEVLVDGSTLHLIRQRETTKDLFALEKIPALELGVTITDNMKE